MFPSLNTFTDTFYNLSSLQFGSVSSPLFVFFFFPCETFCCHYDCPFFNSLSLAGQSIMRCQSRPVVVSQMTWFFCLTYVIFMGFLIHMAQGSPLSPLVSATTLFWLLLNVTVIPTFLQCTCARHENRFSYHGTSSIKVKDFWLQSICDLPPGS